MNPIRKAVIGAALMGCTVAGGAIGASIVGSTASAQTSDSSSEATTTAPAPDAAAPDAGRPARDPSQGGHQANGVTEELLTGDTASQVTAAAQAAVPDGTIERVETDAEGDAYEAHMVKADGSHVTVKLDASFNVTTIEDGPTGPK
jgi:hypothetical protein